jgi:hypothetical protein
MSPKGQLKQGGNKNKNNQFTHGIGPSEAELDYIKEVQFNYMMEVYTISKSQRQSVKGSKILYSLRKMYTKH